MYIFRNFRQWKLLGVWLLSTAVLAGALVAMRAADQSASAADQELIDHLNALNGLQQSLYTAEGIAHEYHMGPKTDFEQSFSSVTATVDEAFDLALAIPEDMNVEITLLRAARDAWVDFRVSVMAAPTPVRPMTASEWDPLHGRLDRAVAMVAQTHQLDYARLANHQAAVSRARSRGILTTGGFLGFLIAGVLYVGVRLQRNLSEWKLRSAHDPLTGVRNRQDFMPRLTEEMERSQQDGATFALLMLDLDHFKLINDRMPHHKASGRTLHPRDG